MQKRPETVQSDRVTIVEYTNGDKCCTHVVRQLQSVHGMQAVLLVSDDRRRIVLRGAHTWEYIRNRLHTVNITVRTVAEGAWRGEFAEGSS